MSDECVMYKKPCIAKGEKGFHFILFIYRRKLIKNGIKIAISFLSFL